MSEKSNFSFLKPKQVLAPTVVFPDPPKHSAINKKPFHLPFHWLQKPSELNLRLKNEYAAFFPDKPAPTNDDVLQWIYDRMVIAESKFNTLVKRPNNDNMDKRIENAGKGGI